MNRDKENTEGISIEDSKFLKWLDNYWYHYKWLTIGIAFALVVFLICTLQTCSRDNEDITVLYAGPCMLSSEEHQKVNAAFNAILPKDYDGDGQKMVTISSYFIYSKEQIQEITAETDEYGVHGFVDTTYNSNQYSTYSNYLLTGESSVLLLDPWLYEALRDNSENVLMKLSDAFSSVPESCEDGYGIRLCDTEAYNEYAVLKNLPEDTVVCLMRPLISGRSAKEENYQIEKEMFAALTGANDIK